VGPQLENKPLTIPAERFVSMLRFDSKGKLDDLGLELSSLGLKSSRLWFESLLLFLTLYISGKHICNK